MPYKLRKAPKRDAYWVVNTETGKKHSNDPLPKDRAEAQMKALYASEDGLKGGAWVEKRYNDLVRENFPQWNAFSPDTIAVDPESQLAFLKAVLNYMEEEKEFRTLKPNYKTFRKLVKDKYKEIRRAGEVLDANLHNHLRNVMFPVLPPLPEPAPAPEPPRAPERELLPRPPEDDRDGDGALDPRGYYPAEGEPAEGEPPRPPPPIPVRRRPPPPPPRPSSPSSPTSPLSPQVRRVVEEMEKKGTKEGLLGRQMTGKGVSGIPVSLLQILARASYSGRTPLSVGGYDLVRSSPTLKLYKKGNTIMVSVRGTEPTDTKDLVADFASVKGGLNETDRYKKDEDFLRAFQQQYPQSKYRYTAVGHSLGGAIIDEFIRAGLVKTAFSFNPMIQPQDRGGSRVHRRLYNNEDPLYLMFGKNVPNVEVRNPRDPLWLAWAKFKLPMGLRELFVAYDAHRIQKFKGGIRINKGDKKSLDDVIVDLYPPNQKEDIVEVRDVPTGRTKVVRTGKKIVDPEFAALPASQRKNTKDPPPQGVKGVRQTINETRVEQITAKQPVKVGEKDLNPIYAKQVDDLEKDLRGLAHFYGYRDPAASLGFRVLADEIKNTLPIYQGRAKKRNDDTHDFAQYFTALTMMGENDIAKANGYAQPTPTQRWDEEVGALFPETQPPKLYDPTNPMSRAKPKGGPSGWDIPPRGRVQAEMLLQKYPQIKGKTMYYDTNK